MRFGFGIMRHREGGAPQTLRWPGRTGSRATLEKLVAPEVTPVEGPELLTEPLSPFAQGDRPTSSLPDLSLVIPTYRQADRIRDQVDAVLKALDELDARGEVLVVIDGDEDGSAERLSDIDDRRLRIAVLDQNGGKGNAVRRGLLSVGGRMRGFLDGGGDIPARSFLDACHEWERTSADIVVASKLHPRSDVDYPMTRRVYSWGYRQVTKYLFGLTVRDTQVGLKIYSAAVVEQVFPLVRTRGFAFDIEALALAERLGFHRIVESPVVIHDRYPSTIGVGTVISMLLETFAVWWYVRRFGPDKHGIFRRRFD